MFGTRHPQRWSAPTAEWLDSPRLVRVVSRVAQQHGLGTEDIEDILQELRIALWKTGPEVRVGGTWVFQVASHKAVDLLRKRARIHHSDAAFAISSDCPCPDRELDHLLHARVAALPSSLREFYDLHYRQGLSEREIGRRLGLCRASVRWLDRCCRRSISG